MQIGYLKDFLVKHKRLIGVFLLGVFVLGSVAVGVILNKRQEVLKNLLQKTKSKMREKYDAELEIGKYGFSGLSTVVLNDILIIPNNRDTLLNISQSEIAVKYWPLVFGKLKFKYLSLETPQLTLVDRDSISNYWKFLKNKSDLPVVNNPSDDKNYGEGMAKLIKRAFDVIPDKINIVDLQVSYDADSVRQSIHMPQASMKAGNFETSFFLNDQKAEWKVNGTLYPRKEEVKVQLISVDKESELPFLREKWGLGVYFEELDFHLKKVKRSKQALAINGEWHIKNLTVDHWRLSEQKINLPQAYGEGGLLIGKDFIEIEKGSTVAVKDFKVSPYFRLNLLPHKILELSVHTGVFPAQSFFDAIPSGLFPTLEGIQTEGTIAYDLDFKVDFNNLDSLYFKSSVDDKELRLKSWGKADLAALNHPFVYQVYEDTALVREILVGPNNRDYTPIEKISPYLKKTILNTEDPYFYEHNGFEEEAFKLSIETNLREKRFKRGASTIPMQLMKNLYLGRNKTMLRKFEEILLVWLMESSDEVSKQRMYEIYLNIIEWGRNVYGVGEAAKYYFGKSPAELNQGESLFLASIVPRPKTGLFSFDFNGRLKPWLRRYFNTYGSIMVKKGDLDGLEVSPGYGFDDVILQARLRPSKPVGLEDSSSLVQTEAERDSIIQELEFEENQRRKILERLRGEQNL